MLHEAKFNGNGEGRYPPGREDEEEEQDDGGERTERRTFGAKGRRRELGLGSLLASPSQEGTVVDLPPELVQ